MTISINDHNTWAVSPRMHTTTSLLIQMTNHPAHITHDHGGNMLIHPGDHDIRTWSTGEKAIWDLLVSVNGGGSVDLYDIADHLRGSDAEPWVFALLTAWITTP